MSKLKLLGCGTSRTLRPHWVMHELGLSYDIEPIYPRTKQAESESFTRINPSQKVPVLDDDGFILSESAAIAVYLADRYGKNNLLPLDVRDRAKSMQWCFFAMMELDAHTLYIIAKHGGKLVHLFAESSVAVETARQGFEQNINILANVFDDERPWILGDQFSVADILVGACVIWSQDEQAMKQKLNLPDSVLAYMERLLAREAYMEACKVNFPQV